MHSLIRTLKFGSKKACQKYWSCFGNIYLLALEGLTRFSLLNIYNCNIFLHVVHNNLPTKDIEIYSFIFIKLTKICLTFLFDYRIISRVLNHTFDGQVRD